MGSEIRRARPFIPVVLALLSLGVLLRAAQASQPPQVSVLLRLQAGSFDPVRERVPGPARLAASPYAPSPYTIVQFDGPVLPE